ncbi:conserved protein of unknown function precursor containing a type A C-terminal secretion signal [Tenacibaculum sp. 190524A02b]|uniref:T9SS type A sorting domain-containing protein n=1 Tax=Tenacibaculum vairaonense TaxID=3137860 RepID=UPI0032B19478
MKKITLVLASTLFTNLSFSQVTLDAEYEDNLSIVKFAKAGDKIVVCNHGEAAVVVPDSTKPNKGTNTIVKIYNLDNSIYKTIDIGNADRIEDVSQHIVNTDDKLELMISHTEYDSANNTNSYAFYIINEDLEEVFRADDWSVGEQVFEGRQHEDKFLFQTQEGVKLLLQKYNNTTNDTKYRVYSLEGSATLSNKEIKVAAEDKAYPNPSIETVNIPYTALNNELVEIQVYDLNGKLLEDKKADNQFNKLKLNVSSYATGTYIYTVKNSLGTYNGKFIKE